MVRRITGEPVHEWDRTVAWGPKREARSHLLLGGNVLSASLLGDPGYAEMEHQVNTTAATVSIIDAKRSGDGLDVQIGVKAELVGHYMPAMETHARYWWVQVAAVDASGKSIASTTKPKSGDDYTSTSPVMFRCTDIPKPECDTLLRPKTTRDFTAHLQMPEGARPEHLEATLFVSVDDKPEATTSKRYALTTAGSAP